MKGFSPRRLRLCCVEGAFLQSGANNMGWGVYMGVGVREEALKKKKGVLFRVCVEGWKMKCVWETLGGVRESF